MEHCDTYECAHTPAGVCGCDCLGCNPSKVPFPWEPSTNEQPRLPTSREEAFLAAVMAGLPRAREKHPDGQRFIGVAAEFGEVANAIDKGEGQERLYSECVDLCVTAMRLALEGNGTR